MSTILHPNQVGVAKQLGINLVATESVESAVSAIEEVLGDSAMQLRARWFVLSVYRHLKKEKWLELEDCPLSESDQLSLVERCVREKGFLTSLGTVTKDARSRFRLVGFASSKKLDRGVLATGTKAYKIAAQTLFDQGMAESKKVVRKQPKQKASVAESKPKAKEIRVQPNHSESDKSVVERRAKRRGYPKDELAEVVSAAEQASDSQQTLAMSEEEFANLDAALNKNDTKIVQQNWGDQNGEERWSRLLGILAGAGFFVFVALLFL